MKAFEPAELETCIRVLEAIVADRGALADAPREERLRLLEAAGRVSLPHRGEQRRLAKTFRRKERQEVKTTEDALLDGTGIRTLRRAPVFATPDPALPSPDEAPRSDRAPEAAPKLPRPRKCYVCKAEFRRLHFFYDQLCPPCAALNYEKRTQTADLSGRTAIVTGGRVKIGYQAAILLLRAGARVLVTTRFPHDAAGRFTREQDFGAWSDRIEIHGLDLRLTPAVERFARLVNEREPRLDFILHNACQTVRRPPAFYAHLVDHEQAPLEALPGEARPLLRAYHEDRRARRGAAAHDDPALLSQAALTPEDRALEPYSSSVALFPAGELDQDLQQIDLRPANSWRMALAEVPTVELLEVHLVNAIAPFVLSARLKPAMLRSPGPGKHIVNVSAVEGQFYREHKTDKHPHTNMAKAALNMLTRTSASDYARDGIFMNSVDTGWVTDEDPAALAARKREEHGFHPPLDVVDGAARICDPIFSGLRTGRHVYGQFFKDYRPVDW